MIEHNLQNDRSRDKRAFLLRKLHSLTGVVPVGVFLVEHLWTNASALGGERSFNRAVDEIQSLPFLPLIEIFGIFLPLAFHAIYGVVLALRGSANVGRYPYTRNWLYVFQRVTGLVTLVFIGYHLYEYRIQKWLFGMQSDAFYGTLTAHLSGTTFGVPWLALFYITGMAAAVFHFANGLIGFSMSWGLTTTRASQERSGYLFAAIGATLFFLGASTIIYFATGIRLLPFKPESTELRKSNVPCPPGR